jgi:hypothetical protein
MWRWLGRGLVVAAVLAAVAAGGWWFHGGRARERFEARVEALRAAGQPTRFEDLAPPPIPDEDNGAKLLAEAHRLLKEREKAPDSADRLLYQATRYPRVRWEDLVPNYGALYAGVFTKFGQHVACLRLARVVMALLEHRQARGAWPESLDALGEMPLDPFSGKPFLYERTERGCTVRAAKEGSPGDL